MSLFAAMASALATSAATAAERVQPQASAADLALVVTLLRFRIHADYCAAELPQSKSQFQSLMEDLASRVQGIAVDLLAASDFRGMKDLKVPARIADALEDSFDDGRHNLEKLDAAVHCPGTLQRFREVDDASLKSDLNANLKAIQSMVQKLEPERER